MTPVRAVIFDLDGTLLDHLGAVTAALHRWLPELGAAPTDDLTRAWLSAEERHFPAWRSRQITFAEQRRRRLRDVLPLLGRTPGDDAELDETFQGYLRHYEASWRCFDDVEEMLEHVSHLPLRTAVLTNGTEAQQRAKLTAVGLQDRFDGVFTAEGLGAAKPDLTTYRRVCRALDVDVDQALHVGDLHDLDVRAPRRAGLQAVHLDRAGTGPLEEHARIRTLSELPGLLRQE